MKRLLIQKSVIAGSYIVLALLLEIITFVTMGLGVVPQYFGLDIAVILIIALIIFVIPHRVAQLIVFGLIAGLQLILSITNEALYSMSGMVFSFGMLNLVGEVTGIIAVSYTHLTLPTT